MSLTLTRADLEDEVGRALGYGRGTLTGDPLADVTACIERGLRQFYTPEVLQGERTSHRCLSCVRLNLWTPTLPVKKGLARLVATCLRFLPVEFCLRLTLRLSRTSQSAAPSIWHPPLAVRPQATLLL